MAEAIRLRIATRQSPANALLKLFSQTSHYAAGNILAMVGGFISLPILTRVLSTAEYGILSLVSTTIWIALALAKGGLQESAVRFYVEFKSGARSQELSIFYTTLLLGSLFLGVITAGIVFGIGNIFHTTIYETRSHNLALVVAGMVVSGALFMRLSNFLRAEQETKTYNLFVVLQRYTVLALGLSFLYYFRDPLKGFLAGSFFGEALIVAILIFILIRQGKFRWGRFSSAFFKECLWFGIPFVGFELANYLLKIVDRYLIQYFLNLEGVGIYSLAYNLCSYVNDALFLAAWYAVYPIYIELWQSHGREATAKFLSNVSIYIFLISIPLIVGFSVLSREVILILASEKYIAATKFLPYLLGGMVFWGFIPIYGAGIYIYKKTKALAALTFAALLLNIGLNLFLIPRIHLHGAALATLLSYVFLIVAVIRYAFRYLKFSIDYKVVAEAIFASLVMYVVLASMSSWSGLPTLLPKMLIGAATYALIILAMNRKLRALARDQINKRSFL